MVHPGEVAAAELAKAKASIRDAFLLFGKEETMTIHDEDVATVLRFLGLYPTTADLVDKILPEMQGDTPGKYVAYEQFEERVLEYQSSGLFVPDTEETLLQAFRVSETPAAAQLPACTFALRRRRHWTQRTQGWWMQIEWLSCCKRSKRSR